MPRHRHDIRGDINVIISCKANTFFWQIEQGYILNIYIGVLAILFNYHWFWRFCSVWLSLLSFYKRGQLSWSQFWQPNVHVW